MKNAKYLFGFIFILFSCTNENKKIRQKNHAERKHTDTTDISMSTRDDSFVHIDSNKYKITEQDVIIAADKYIKNHKYDRKTLSINKSYSVLIGDLNNDNHDDAMITWTYEGKDGNYWNCFNHLFINDKGNLTYADAIGFYCRVYSQNFVKINNGIIYSTLNRADDDNSKITDINYKVIKNKLVIIDEKAVDIKIKDFEAKENEKYSTGK